MNPVSGRVDVVYIGPCISCGASPDAPPKRGCAGAHDKLPNVPVPLSGPTRGASNSQINPGPTTTVVLPVPLPGPTRRASNSKINPCPTEGPSYSQINPGPTGGASYSQINPGPTEGPSYSHINPGPTIASTALVPEDDSNLRRGKRLRALENQNVKPPFVIPFASMLCIALA